MYIPVFTKPFIQDLKDVKKDKVLYERLWKKIEELLNKKPISVEEIASITNNKSKSIATQLSKLCKVGVVKRIKKGIYSLV